MAITEPYELDGVSIDGTEISIVSGTTSAQSVTDDGVYQVWVDGTANLTKTDYFELRGYEKVEATGGTQGRFFTQGFGGVQSGPFVTPSFILLHGWDFRLIRIAGTARAIDASIRKVA